MKADFRHQRWVDRGAYRVSPRVIACGRGLRRDARMRRDVVRDYDEWVERPNERELDVRDTT